MTKQMQTREEVKTIMANRLARRIAREEAERAANDADASLRALLRRGMARGVTLKESWNHFNPAGLGMITPAQFIDGMASLGIEMHSSASDAFLTMVPTDRGGYVGWNQFLIYCETGPDPLYEADFSKLLSTQQPVPRAKRTSASSSTTELQSTVGSGSLSSIRQQARQLSLDDTALAMDSSEAGGRMGMPATPELHQVSFDDRLSAVSRGSARSTASRLQQATGRSISSVATEGLELGDSVRAGHAAGAQANGAWDASVHGPTGPATKAQQEQTGGTRPPRRDSAGDAADGSGAWAQQRSKPAAGRRKPARRSATPDRSKGKGKRTTGAAGKSGVRKSAPGLDSTISQRLTNPLDEDVLYGEAGSVMARLVRRNEAKQQQRQRKSDQARRAQLRKQLARAEAAASSKGASAQRVTSSPIRPVHPPANLRVPEQSRGMMDASSITEGSMDGSRAGSTTFMSTEGFDDLQLLPLQRPTLRDSTVSLDRSQAVSRGSNTSLATEVLGDSWQSGFRPGDSVQSQADALGTGAFEFPSETGNQATGGSSTAAPATTSSPPRARAPSATQWAMAAADAALDSFLQELDTKYEDPEEAAEQAAAARASASPRAPAAQGLPHSPLTDPTQSDGFAPTGAAPMDSAADFGLDDVDERGHVGRGGSVPTADRSTGAPSRSDSRFSERKSATSSPLHDTHGGGSGSHSPERTLGSSSSGTKNYLDVDDGLAFTQVAGQEEDIPVGEEVDLAVGKFDVTARVAEDYLMSYTSLTGPPADVTFNPYEDGGAVRVSLSDTVEVPGTLRTISKVSDGAGKPHAPHYLSALEKLKEKRRLALEGKAASLEVEAAASELQDDVNKKAGNGEEEGEPADEAETAADEQRDAQRKMAGATTRIAGPAAHAAARQRRLADFHDSSPYLTGRPVDVLIIPGLFDSRQALSEALHNVRYRIPGSRVLIASYPGLEGSLWSNKLLPLTPDKLADSIAELILHVRSDATCAVQNSYSQRVASLADLTITLSLSCVVRVMLACCLCWPAYRLIES